VALNYIFIYKISKISEMGPEVSNIHSNEGLENIPVASLQAER
jgi:hypothetical protein